MAMPYFVNPKKSKWSRDWTGAHTHVGMVKGHKRHVNPKKKARRKLSSVARAARTTKRATRRRVRRFSAAQLAAQRAFAAMARARSGKARTVRRAASVSTNPRRTGGTMAKRKRRRSAVGRVRRRKRRAVSVNPRRTRRRRRTAVVRHRRNPAVRRTRRRRSFRRNPGFSGGGILRQIMRGAGDGLAVTAGQGLTNYVSAKIPFGQSTTIGQSATQLVVGTALGMAVKKITRSERAAAFFVAGAYSNVIRKLAASTPLAPFLSGVGVYPRPATVGVYPRPKLAGYAGRDGFGSQSYGGARGRDTSNDLGVGTDLAVMGAAGSPGM